MSEVDFILGSAEQWLPVRLTATEGEDLQLCGEDIKVATHQAMRPVFIDRHGAVEQLDLALIISSAQEDH